jgi:hypothetical protein
MIDERKNCSRILSDPTAWLAKEEKIATKKQASNRGGAEG